MNYQVRFKDIDPDTGLVSQDTMIASCETCESAEWIVHALGVESVSQGGSHDPNREFYVLDCSTSL